VLVLLFVKYVSDKYADQPGGRFADMVALKGDKEIGDKFIGTSWPRQTTSRARSMSPASTTRKD
jgi:hypothetical protein